MISVNRELPMLAAVQEPQFVDKQLIKQCQTYRDAVRLCWALRRVKGMTQRTVAELADIHTPHISDYLAERAKTVRNLPADKIEAFESVCGNRAITQWLVRRAGLHLAEELMRAA